MNLETFTIPGKDVLTELEKRRKAFPTTGLYPFIIGDDSDLFRLKEYTTYSTTEPASMVEKSKSFDVKAWIESRRNPKPRGRRKIIPFDPDNYLGEWPDTDTTRDLLWHQTDLHKEERIPKSKVIIGQVKINASWELPAVLLFAEGCSDIPAEPDEHAGIHRHWQDKYGAEIITLSGDTIECHVANPPRNRETALELAWEHFHYNPEDVYSVRQLASTLVNSHYWFFWWD